MAVKQEEGWTRRPKGIITPSSANDSEWIRLGYPPNIAPMSQSISPASERYSQPDDADEFGTYSQPVFQLKVVRRAVPCCGPFRFS